MKPLLPLATILTLTLPVVAFAAPAGSIGSPPATKPQSAPRIEPAAIALLDRAIASYKAPNGLRMKIETARLATKKPDVTTTTIEWKPPSLLRIEKKRALTSSTTLVDGKNVYFLTGQTSFQRMPFVADKLPPHAVAGIAGTAGAGIGQFLPALLSGQNSLIPLPTGIAVEESSRTYARTLPRTIIEGEECNGLRQTAYITMGDLKFRIESTGWFSAQDDRLRRVQQIVHAAGKQFVTIDKILETELNPTWDDVTFVWSPPPGAKERKLDEPGEPSIYWDPKVVPGVAPQPLTGKDLKGKTLSLSQYKGKVVLLDFWATWCGPCLMELPTVERIYKTYHPKGLEIIGVSLDTNKKALTDFLKSHRMPWPQIFDGKQFDTPNAQRYKVKGIPFTLLIGKDGKIAAVNPRGDALEPAVKAALSR